MIDKNFGKIESNVFGYAPVPIIVDGIATWTNDPAVYAAEGYLPVEHTSKPQREGYWYELTWVEQDGVIVQTWVEHENPPTDQISDAEALSIITGGAV